VFFDISWDQVAINSYPDRFLFGTDKVAPASQDNYLRVHEQHRSLWALVTKDASEMVRKPTTNASSMRPGSEYELGNWPTE
jgi:hypothetical protein